MRAESDGMRVSARIAGSFMILAVTLAAPGESLPQQSQAELLKKTRIFARININVADVRAEPKRRSERGLARPLLLD